MPRKYLRITEVTKVCGVNVKFVKRLEQEQVIYPIVRGSEKFYPLDQVDRVRVAHLLIEEMGVKLRRRRSRAKHARANDRHAAPV